MIGVIQLSADWGLSMEGELLADSAAALGVVKRKGVREAEACVSVDGLFGVVMLMVVVVGVVLWAVVDGFFKIDIVSFRVVLPLGDW